MPATRSKSNAAGSDVDIASVAKDSDGKLPSVGRKRTRTGCLNCRRKRRKCDEKKPTCAGCRGRKEVCEWGVKVSFRPENAQTVDHEHPSMRQGASTARYQSFQIVDVTAEVIRDYFEETPNNDSIELPIIDQPSSRGTFEGTDSKYRDPRGPGHISFDSPIVSTLSPTYVTSLSVPTNDELFSSPNLSDSVFEDGIFLPGSQYQELHAALRSRIISTARSTVPSRLGSLEPDVHLQHPEHSRSASAADDDDEESRRLAHLSPQQEYVLWQNYINEVAPWCDKFDNDRHFELALPMMAKSHMHLKYAILALSARQIERKEQTADNSCSLALYQHAIHLLSPLLQTRTSVVLASCVVLGVLEMLSCSPKAWRRHLDGCAALIQALGIYGSCGGLEQALFWTFARMDICGSFISSERTLIPISVWMGGGDIMNDLSLFSTGTFDMCANQIVYLCGRVVEQLCTSGHWAKGHERRSNILNVVNDTDDNEEWLNLFELIEEWYRTRREEMKPLLTIPNNTSLSEKQKPFPTVFFGNGPATSGNQMYHTAALLMLKYKPPSLQLAKKPRSMLWHARQICAISISNTNHACWTNSTQPLWIAGQLMSHPSEHQAILDIYGRIERETGWATRWRMDDLREYWGDDND